jgi:hypothetical protein
MSSFPNLFWLCAMSIFWDLGLSSWPCHSTFEFGF